MAKNLPDPASRKEEFLAKAAGKSGIKLPEPASREEEYLNAIAKKGGGGGTSYTAGDGIDITDDTISVDTDTIQEKLTAGTGINITNNTISATGGGGTTYTAGDGIDITNDTISVDTDTIQEKLTAGNGIDITNNTISANGGGGITETFTKATADWSALAASSPYTYSTTVTLATTLGANNEVELINDQLIAFANYGFGILSVSGQVATIASIGQPNSSITFKIKVRG